MRCVAWVMVGVASACAGRAGENEVTQRVHAYFAASDRTEKTGLVHQIEADPTYDPSRLSECLHRAGLFEPIAASIGQLQRESVELTGSRGRDVYLRLPPQYDPARPWPLIYALHGTGGQGPDIIAYLERLLGPRADDYLIAAPDGYGQYVIHDPGPDDEHLRVLAHLHRRFHLDSNRIHITGYSRGGHATWALGVLHADQFASGLALAGTFAPTGVDALWDSFLPNVRHLPIWTVWGAGDTKGDVGQHSPEGGIAGVNQKLREAAKRLQLPANFIALSDRAHGDVRPADDVIAAWLSARRVVAPAAIEHSFRWPYQAQTYWLEAAEWKGPAWDNATSFTVTPRKDETPQDAYHRELRSRLGRISGRIEGQNIDVRRDQVQEVTIWISDGMIDWSQPVVVKVSGRAIFEGSLKRDLGVCLAQVARTYDLDRLRWAGIRFRAGRKAELVKP